MQAQPALHVVAAGLLTVKEAASRLRASPASVYKLCELGKLPHARISTHAIRIAAADLADFIATQLVPGSRNRG